MINNILKISAFDLKMNKKQILGWFVSIFSIMFMYMILFPSVQDMAQIKLDSMPEELLQFMGMNSMADMGNFVSYFVTIYNLILISISIFACVFGANLIAKEEKNKTIEFLYSLKISKIEIYISKFFTAYVAVMLMIVSAVVASLICGFMVGGETFSLARMIEIVKFTSITPFIFLSLAVMLTGITAKVSAASTSSIVVISCYVLGFLSTMVSSSFQWLKYLSPFQVFSAQSGAAFDEKAIINMSVYFCVMVVMLFVGTFAYNKRDYKI